MSSTQTVAVVTGAARGIGRGIAERLGADGHHVLAADLPHMADGTAVTVEGSRRAGGTATAAEVDVTDEDSTRELVQAAVSAGGQLDVFVANAGIAQVEGLEKGQALKKYSQDILLGRVSVPEDVASLVSYLAGPDSAYVTGQTMLVDGGMQFS